MVMLALNFSERRAILVPNPWFLIPGRQIGAMPRRVNSTFGGGSTEARVSL